MPGQTIEGGVAGARDPECGVAGLARHHCRALEALRLLEAVVHIALPRDVCGAHADRQTCAPSPPQTKLWPLDSLSSSTLYPLVVRVNTSLK
jgi:hypothetical protein